MTGQYHTQVLDLPEMEELERGWMVAILMWILAIGAMIRTTVEVVVSFPFWLLVHRGDPKQGCGLAAKHWYEGPYGGSSLFFDTFSKTLHEIRKGATGAGALHFIYNWPERAEWNDVDLDQKSRLGSLLADWWINMNNARAVRNRRVLVRYLLRRRFEHFAMDHPNETLRILSVACGSAQPLLEALSDARGILLSHNVRVELRLLDKSQRILTHAMCLVVRYALGEQLTVTTHCCSYHELRRVCDNGAWQPHIVEMIGLMDYLSRPKGEAVVRDIYEVLAPGGVFYTGHIMPNREAFPLRWLIAWAMFYRTPDQLGDIVDVMFVPNHISLYIEPGRVHVVAEARKS